MIKIEIGDQN